jgi:protoheme IX farnesyltransferase
MIREYYRLCKPGIVYSNAFMALAAYLFAVHGTPNIMVAAALLLGVALVVAGAAAFNNVIEKDVDARMERTRSRALPAGVISPRRALIFATVLSLAGLAILFLHVSPLVCGIVLFGMLVYVAVYTPSKRLTSHSTLIGAVAGAIPPVAGYAAGAHAIDATALLLCVILACWQMAHFFAIGIYRADDYRSAGLPILPTLRLARAIQHRMLFYTAFFVVSVILLGFLNSVSIIYWLLMGSVSIGWLFLCEYGYFARDTHLWAKRMFLYSLIVLLLLILSLALA